LSQKRQFFGENILKILTSVPDVLLAPEPDLRLRDIICVPSQACHTFLANRSRLFFSVADTGFACFEFFAMTTFI
jgi:hypothetical protein